MEQPILAYTCNMLVDLPKPTPRYRNWGLRRGAVRGNVIISSSTQTQSGINQISWIGSPKGLWDLGNPLIGPKLNPSNQWRVRLWGGDTSGRPAEWSFYLKTLKKPIEINVVRNIEAEKQKG